MPVRRRVRARDSGTLAYERLHVYASWQDRAHTWLSLDRPYVKDLGRDHVGRYDRSPAREQEREQSMEQTFALAMGDRPRQPERTQERIHERVPLRQRTHALDDCGPWLPSWGRMSPPMGQR